MKRKIVLTGIQSTGDVHVGNYVGAIRPALEYLEDESVLPIYFIADYHALTGVRDSRLMRTKWMEVAAAWMAFGLDPERVIIYKQSDIPEIFELLWVLSCMSPKGLMNRAHAYKAAVAKNIETEEDPDAGINMGLFNYPVLMAADILLFQTDLVPVGSDQVQHVEIARDLATNFNNSFGNVLKVPDYVVPKLSALVPGLDGRKMSKSYNNTIPLFLPSAQLRKSIMRIKTDSTPPGEPKQVEGSLIYQLYEHFSTAAEQSTLRDHYAQGLSWADAKQLLFERLDHILADPRSRYEELMSNPLHIEEQLKRGAEKAREAAKPLMEKIRKAVGVQ